MVSSVYLPVKTLGFSFKLTTGSVLLSGFVFALAMLLAATVAFAQDYPSGHGALELFDEKGMAEMPPLIHLWVNVMMGVFALGLLFVWNYPIARWLVGGFILTVILVLFVYPALNIPVLGGLIGLTHIVCWSPGLYCMLKTRPFFKEVTFYSVWAGVITAVILISFIFDIRDAGIYLAHIFGAA